MVTYTGNVITVKLLKVSDDSNNYPLDDNNNKSADSGLPQSMKDNASTDPNYIAPYMDTSRCHN